MPKSSRAETLKPGSLNVSCIILKSLCLCVCVCVCACVHVPQCMDISIYSDLLSVEDQFSFPRLCLHKASGSPLAVFRGSS